MRNFSAENVELLDRDNYRHVVILDSEDMMEIRHCVHGDILKPQYILSRSPRRKIFNAL